MDPEIKKLIEAQTEAIEAVAQQLARIADLFEDCTASGENAKSVNVFNAS